MNNPWRSGSRYLLLFLAVFGALSGIALFVEYLLS